jgi:hypothetical protein
VRSALSLPLVNTADLRTLPVLDLNDFSLIRASTVSRHALPDLRRASRVRGLCTPGLFVPRGDVGVSGHDDVAKRAATHGRQLGRACSSAEKARRARNTLLLSDANYCAFLALPFLIIYSHFTNKTLQTPVPSHALVADAGTHSARSILLLEDSPAKAVLPLHDHVCPREYDEFFRAADIQGLHAAQQMN